MDIHTPAQLGALLRDRREKAGLTQAALAGQLGVSTKWIRQAEHGASGTGVGPLLRALSILGVALQVPPPGASVVRSRDTIDVPDVDAIVAAAQRRVPPTGSGAG